MSLQIVAVKEDAGFNRPQLGNVSFNTSKPGRLYTIPSPVASNNVIEDKTKVAADERTLSRLPPLSLPPSYYYRVLNL
ncbi:hypothetical protein N7501_002583 [Penicillium viridicatum]|nr:hypothetical protein N7501_002583 [Penicillium viridicatum]